MMSGMAFAKINATLTPAGHGCRLEVNGQDITANTRAFAISTAADEVTRLTVELFGEGTVEGEGIVEVIRAPSDEDLRAYVAQWLDEVDPDEITLEGMPMSVGPVEAVLDALRKRAASG